MAGEKLDPCRSRKVIVWAVGPPVVTARGINCDGFEGICFGLGLCWVTQFSHETPAGTFRNSLSGLADFCC